MTEQDETKIDKKPENERVKIGVRNRTEQDKITHVHVPTMKPID